ncbi:MAG: TetR/AcrR family transcriptional regulator [Coriobacteriales bacterium]|jgi:AcrR family transcriptional regulator
MSAKDAIERSFRKLIAEKPYSKITVTEICRGAHVSRKSFYDSFDCKADIVEWVFNKDVIEPLRSVNSAIPMRQLRSFSNVFMENVYEKVQSDAEFYRHLAGPTPSANNVLVKAITDSIVKLNNELLEEYFQVNDLERDYVSYFYASAQALLIQKWVADGMPISPHQLAELYLKMFGSYWTDKFDVNFE